MTFLATALGPDPATILAAFWGAVEQMHDVSNTLYTENKFFKKA